MNMCPKLNPQTDPSKLWIACVDASNAAIYANLSQNYEAEFSPLTGKSPDERGLYEYTVLKRGYDGYLAFRGEVPVAFMVVDSLHDRFDVAEFYVIPSMRKQKIGLEFAHAIFDRYCGAWQVRQIKGADGAYRFWVSVVATYTDGEFSDGIEADSQWGEVRIQRFSSAASEV